MSIQLLVRPTLTVNYSVLCVHKPLEGSCKLYGRETEGGARTCGGSGGLLGRYRSWSIDAPVSRSRTRTAELDLGALVLSGPSAGCRRRAKKLVWLYVKADFTECSGLGWLPSGNHSQGCPEVPAQARRWDHRSQGHRGARGARGASRGFL